MKVFTCEMCGSNGLAKRGDVYVCKGCGTEYSVEDAKRQMTEVEASAPSTAVAPAPAPAEPEKPVSDELKNLYELARRAKSMDNSEGAAKYYEMILIKDPSSWEANFYTVYYKSMSCRIADIASAAIAVKNCIGVTMELIRDNVSDEDERLNAVMTVKEDAYAIAGMLSSAAQNHYNGIDFSIRYNYRTEYLSRTIAAESIYGEVCDQLIRVFLEDAKVFASFGVATVKQRLQSLSGDMNSVTARYVKAIKKYEPTYTRPYKAPANNTSNTNNTATDNNGNSNCAGAGCVWAAIIGVGVFLGLVISGVLF